MQQGIDIITARDGWESVGSELQDLYDNNLINTGYTEQPWGHADFNGIDLNSGDYAWWQSVQGLNCGQMYAVYAADLIHELFHYDTGPDDYNIWDGDCTVNDSHDQWGYCLYEDSFGRGLMHRNHNDDGWGTQ